MKYCHYYTSECLTNYPVPILAPVQVEFAPLVPELINFVNDCRSCQFYLQNSLHTKKCQWPQPDNHYHHDYHLICNGQVYQTVYKQCTFIILAHLYRWTPNPGSQVDYDQKCVDFANLVWLLFSPEYGRLVVNDRLLLFAFLQEEQKVSDIFAVDRL